MTIKSTALGMASLTVLGWLSLSAGAQAQQAADILIRGGTIYDGSEGNKGFTGDVAISGDKIVYVGPHADVSAKRTVDAKGLIVAPGFIDVHTHPNEFLEAVDPKLRQVPALVMQGVSTIFIGVEWRRRPRNRQYLRQTEAAGRRHQCRHLCRLRRHPLAGDRPGQPGRRPRPSWRRRKAWSPRACAKARWACPPGLFYVPQSFFQDRRGHRTRQGSGQARRHLRHPHPRLFRFHRRHDEFLQGSPHHRQGSGPAGASGHIKTIGPVVWGKSSMSSSW